MCEKPISVDVITTEEVLAKAKSKPHLKFLVPFCRRCECVGIQVDLPALYVIE